MRTYIGFLVVAALLAAFTFNPNLHAQPLVNIETVAVGDPGNAADLTRYGRVTNVFAIGKYEVTIGQYTTFLNSVASVASSNYLLNLWNTTMATNLKIAGISRSGSGILGDPYVYSPIAPAGITPVGASSTDNRPIAHVSWFDAARFANWMNNGATNGASTETGAYTLNGATSGTAPARNPNATWWIPSSDQWYKAAYYKGGGTNAGYSVYPMQSGSIDPPSYPHPTNNINALGATNQANFVWTPPIQPPFQPNRYTVTQGSTESNSQNYLTDVGAFSNSSSAYGTYDQGGNVTEWMDFSDSGQASPRLYGGGWNGTSQMRSDDSFGSGFRPTPDYEANNTGFRVASLTLSGNYWAPGVGGGGSGTWGSGSDVWAAVPAWQGSSPQRATGPLIFGNTAGTVTVSGTVNAVAGMQFSTDGYTVLSNTITLAGASIAANTIITDAFVGATINSVLTGSAGMTKAGTGTLTLGGGNTYTGDTAVNAGTLRFSTENGAGGSRIIQTALASLVEFLGGGRMTNQMTVFRYSFANSFEAAGQVTLADAASSIAVASGATVTGSGSFIGTGGLTKKGLGTLSLTAGNSFSGPLSVEAGTLALAASGNSAAGSVTSVGVSNGAMLLISQSNQVNNNATVTLSGGTITRGSGVSEVFGNLNLTQASFLNFGTGAAGNLTFGTYQGNAQTESAVLTINNFLPGNTFTFSSTSFSQGSINSYFQFGTGFVGYSLSNTDSTFTITAIPEPSTYLAAIGLLALMLWPLRRRKCAKVS